MAATDLDGGDIKKQEQLDDITTCCICTEVYTDPKALPCNHTFCMKCIQETGLKSNKGPGDEMPCPICRQLFKIPPEGFRELRKHFFTERFIQVSNVSGPSALTKALCSVCLEECKEQEGKETPTADTYCVECKHNLCEECSSEHRKFKATKNHKLIPVNECESDQHVLTYLVCELHKQKDLDVYCADCKTVVCAICFIEEHNNHKGSHVNKCLDGFRKQIQNNTEAMNECISETQMKKVEIIKAKEEMQQEVESLECDVEKRKDEIKQLADKHASRLLQSLCSKREAKLKEIQMATDDIDAYLSNLESYNSYCQRIMAKVSATDICSALPDLSLSATELQQSCQPIIQRRIQDLNLCFRQSKLEELLEEDCGNLIGEIEEEGELKPKKRSKQILLADLSNKNDILRQENDKLRQELEAERTTNNSLQTSNDKLVEELKMYRAPVKTFETNAEIPEKLREEDDRTEAGELRYKSDPVLVQTIRTKAAEQGTTSIRGLTILDKELFVVNAWSLDVEVHDTIKLNFSRRWNLKELSDPLDIGSCNRNKCLYIFDYKSYQESHEIWRVDPDGEIIKKWSTGCDYGWGLSVTDESNVILAVRWKNKLNEYSPDGQMLREVNVSDAGICRPLHAIKLTNGHFVVSHSFNDLHRVCIVDADGKLKKSFGGKSGSTIAQINEPIHLSVDGNGFVMVADRLNSRVLLLDADLEFKREILSREEKHGLRRPSRILLDESDGRLFVVNNQSNNQLILIFDFK